MQRAPEGFTAKDEVGVLSLKKTKTHPTSYPSAAPRWFLFDRYRPPFALAPV
jgi:hypothetical protein